MSEEQKPSMIDYLRASDLICIPDPFLYIESEDQEKDRLKRTVELARHFMQLRIEEENRVRVKKEQERQDMKDLIKEVVREVLNENNTN